MSSQLTNNRGITLVVVLMVMTILLSVIGGALLFSGINTKMTANYQSGGKAFNAADTGINAAIAQLGTSTAAFSVNLGGGLGYRSGPRNATSAQPLKYVGSQPGTGGAIGSGGLLYNGGNGHSVDKYQINVTGTFTTSGGTELAGREIEALATYSAN